MITYRRMIVITALSLLTGCNVPNGYLRQRAEEDIGRGQISAADTKLTKAVNREGDDWKAAMMLGEVRLIQHRPLDAQILLEHALAIREHDPDMTPRILDGIAESLYQQERVENLHGMLESACKDRGGVRDYLRQGKYLGLLGDPDGSRLAFRKAARFAAPDDPTPYLAMADYYDSIKDGPHAVEALRRAYAIIPNSPTLQDRLRAYGVVPGPTVALPPEHVGEIPEE